MKKQMTKKMAAGMLTAAAFMMLTASPAMADWKQQTDGTWNWQEEGQNVRSSWKQINGKWYYFNETGVMQAGWLQKDGKWYYLDPKNGDMKEGWVKEGDKWYFLNSTSGEMSTGWVKEGENWYFLDASGSMQTGVIEVDGKIYALDETNGTMCVGTVLLSDKIVYTFNSVTGEAIGDRLPIPTKAYSTNGQKQADISASVKEQIQQMQQKQREESRSSSSSSKSENNNSSNNKPDKDDSNNKPDKDDSSNDNAATEVTIQEITIPKNGMIDIVLSQAAELQMSDFYISCPTGKDMTILKVETEEGEKKNKVYHITTAYFNDNTYQMEITLSNGKRLEKMFVTNLAAPEIANIEVKRKNATTAEISFVSDSAGILYYIAVPNAAARQVIGEQIPQTAQEVKEKGNSMQFNKKGLYSLIVEGLETNQAYTIYFASAQGEEDQPVLRGSVLIPPQSQQDEDNNNDGKEIKLVKVDAISNSKIKVVFNQPLTQSLTLENFDVSCPLGETSIGSLETADNITYIISMKEYHFMMNNTTYTVRVTLPNGKQLEGKCYTSIDVDYPNLNEKKVRRIAEDEIEVTFRSNERGIFYYGTTENPEEKELPRVEEIIQTAPSEKLHAGFNKLRIKINKDDRLFYIVPVDEKGNKPSTFAEKREIPFEIESAQGEKTNDILSVETSEDSRGNLILKVVLKEAVSVPKIEALTDIKLYTLEGEGPDEEPKIMSLSPRSTTDTFEIKYNLPFSEGRYELELRIDKIKYNKEFEIN